MRSIRNTLLAVTLLCALSSHAAYNRWAIISSPEAKEAGFADLVFMEAAKLEGIELVERDAIQKVIDELGLTAFTDGGDVKGRLLLGQRLQADALVFLSMPRLKKANGRARASGFLKLLVAECDYGARLGAMMLADDLPAGTNAIDAAAYIAKTRAVYGNGVKEIVAVLPFVSRNLTHEYDHLQDGYSYVLQNALRQLPGVAVLEVEEAKAIAGENLLIADTVHKRIVPLFVNGELRIEGATGGSAVTVSFTITVKSRNRDALVIKKADIPFAESGAWLGGEVQAKIAKEKKLAEKQPLSIDEQSRELVSRSKDFAVLGYWKIAAGMLDAALLVDPDDVDTHTELVKILSKLWRYRSPEHQRLWLRQQRLVLNLLRNKLIEPSAALDLLDTVLYDGQVFKGKRRDSFIRTGYPLVLDLAPELRIVGTPERIRWHRELMDQASRSSSTFVYEIERKYMMDGDRIAGELFNGVDDYEELPSLLAQTRSELDDIYERFQLMEQDVRAATAYVSKKNPGQMYDAAIDLIADWTRYCLTHGIELTTEGRRGHRYYRSFMNKLVMMQHEVWRHKAAEIVGDTVPASERPPTSDEGLFFLKVDIPSRIKRRELALREAGKTKPLNLSSLFKFARVEGSATEVVWSPKEIYHHPIPGRLVRFDFEPPSDIVSLAWDDDHAWVGTREDGLYLVSPDGTVEAHVGLEQGLPPADRRMRVLPVSKTAAVVSGSFGPNRRGWCALVEPLEGKVKIVHEATKARKELRIKQYADIKAAFEPTWIARIPADSSKVRVGRLSTSPLVVDLDSFVVSVDSNCAPNGLPDDPQLASQYGLWTPGQTPDNCSLSHMWCHLRKGIVYVPGTGIWCEANNRGRIDKIMKGWMSDHDRQPSFAVSVHYGLIGWGGRVSQILVKSDKEWQTELEEKLMALQRVAVSKKVTAIADAKILYETAIIYQLMDDLDAAEKAVLDSISIRAMPQSKKLLSCIRVGRKISGTNESTITSIQYAD